MIIVLHLITGLGRGGAEGALARLVLGMDRTRFHSVVVSLRAGGAWAAPLGAAGIEVRSLDMDSPLDLPRARKRLRRIVAEIRPNIVESWLYHADLMAALTSGGARLAWNLRNSDLSQSRRLSWRILVMLLARFSRRPDVIISNSRAGLDAHLRRGYQPRRALVIPNGIDTRFFRPGNRAAARALLGLPPEGFLVGMPARLEGFKDHATFLAAATLLARTNPDAGFVLAGTGATLGNVALSSGGLGRRLHLLGEIANMPEFYAAVDLVTLTSSHGEGFPNVIGEAMACARPVVATDVGDVRALVGDAGQVVPPCAPQALADAWAEIARLNNEARAAVGARGLAHIERNFTLDTAIAAYQELYEELASR